MRRSLIIVALVFAPLAAILVDHAFAQQPANPAGFFITSSTSGTGQPRRPGRRRQDLPGAGNGGRRAAIGTWRAYLSTEWRRRRERPRPDRLPDPGTTSRVS